VRRLPESELDVMEVLWAAAEPLTTRAVVQAVPDDRAWKIQTVATLLSRLEAKEFVTADRTGRDIRYTPLVGRDAYLAFETDRFMERFHQGSLRSLLASFSGGQQVDEDQRRELEAWLDAHERGEA
jgi:predicted transcriptional regulator